MELETLKRDLKTLNHTNFGLTVVKNNKNYKNDKTLKNKISVKLRFLYYLLKNTPYTNESNKEFHFIYTYFLTIDIGLLINNYYKIPIEQDRLIYDIMKNEYIKFFDHSKSCIINLKNNKDFGIFVTIYYQTDNFNPRLVKLEIKPDISILLQGLKFCEEKKKYKGDNIICNLYIYLYIDNVLTDEGHANTLVFNKSKKEIYRVEPNYATQEEIELMSPEDKKYYNYFETLFSKPMNDALSGYFNGKIDYAFKGYYDFNNRTYPNHGGFCNFLSILTIYTDVKLTREIVKQNLLNFIKWEYRKFSGRRLNEKFNFNDYKNSLIYFLNVLQGKYAGKIIESIVIDNHPFTEKQEDIFTLDNFKSKFNKIEIKTLSLNKFNLNFKFELI